MTYKLFYAPDRGEEMRQSMQLDILYRKWPNRVLSLFDRYEQNFKTYTGWCRCVTWRRKPLQTRY